MTQSDLNLLLALDVLLEEQSVTVAASRLNLSVPATSRTLARIRQAFGDPILVRAGRGLVPTPHALAIRDDVHALVTQGRGLFQAGRALDPVTGWSASSRPATRSRPAGSLSGGSPPSRTSPCPGAAGPPGRWTTCSARPG
jgi:DNA-binding transcriptional LysR family regulator